MTSNRGGVTELRDRGLEQRLPLLRQRVRVFRQESLSALRSLKYRDRGGESVIILLHPADELGLVVQQPGEGKGGPALYGAIRALLGDGTQQCRRPAMSYWRRAADLHDLRILRVVTNETLDGPVGFPGLPAAVHHPEQGVNGRGVAGGRLGQLHHAGDIFLRVGPRRNGFLAFVVSRRLAVGCEGCLLGLRVLEPNGFEPRRSEPAFALGAPVGSSQRHDAGTKASTPRTTIRIGLIKMLPSMGTWESTGTPPHIILRWPDRGK